MSEAKRGMAVSLFSYGQLESKDETEEVTEWALFRTMASVQ